MLMVETFSTPFQRAKDTDQHNQWALDGIQAASSTTLKVIFQIKTYLIFKQDWISKRSPAEKQPLVCTIRRENRIWKDTNQSVQMWQKFVQNRPPTENVIL